MSCFSRKASLIELKRSYTVQLHVTFRPIMAGQKLKKVAI